MDSGHFWCLRLAGYYYTGCNSRRLRCLDRDLIRIFRKSVGANGIAESFYTVMSVAHQESLLVAKSLILRLVGLGRFEGTPAWL